MARKSDAYQRTGKKQMPVYDHKGSPLQQDEDPYEGLLSMEEMEEIELEVAREFEQLQHEDAKERYRKDYRWQYQIAQGEEEEELDVLIDLPGHSARIVLDGIAYYHGHIYFLPYSKVTTILDVMGRAWDHEESVGGANTNSYRRPLNTTVGGSSHTVLRAPTQQGAPAGAAQPMHSSVINSRTSLSAGRLQPGVRF